MEGYCSGVIDVPSPQLSGVTEGNLDKHELVQRAFLPTLERNTSQLRIQTVTAATTRSLRMYLFHSLTISKYRMNLNS
jgi:hypothetical protein